MISLFLAQSKETAERLVKIGAPAKRVKVMGNLKYDVRVGSESALTAMVRSRLPAGAKVLVCGSSLEGEEKILLEAWPAVLAAEPNAVMVIAPRHPDRFAAVAEMVAASGFDLTRASGFRQRPEMVAAGGVFLLDTIGDLASMYGVATVAFVGGSLVAKGGHNPLEPAQFGVPVVMGPSFENFREIVGRMRAGDAIQIVSAETVASSLVAMLCDAVSARALGERGRAVFEEQTGATARAVDELTLLLQERPVTVR
jgi:3-deoxy-D-manno-octulosonic-acid transferase